MGHASTFDRQNYGGQPVIGPDTTPKSPLLSQLRMKSCCVKRNECAQQAASAESEGTQAMIKVVRDSWALLIGTTIIMIAHGLSTSLIGVRGIQQELDAGAVGLVMAGYYAGFLLSSTFTPHLVRRVGHVRVFSAYASVASASLILFSVATDSGYWTFLRFINGACMAGIYIVAESWLNGINANSRRGQALGMYVCTQLVGLVAGQWILSVGDPLEPGLFIVATVLMSVGFGPILLSASPVPVYETARPLSFRELYAASPLASAGIALMGLTFGILFSMLSVYGVSAGLSLGEIAALVAVVYIGGSISQYPAGWLSDRFGRRLIIGTLALFSATICLAQALIGFSGVYLFVAVGLVGAGVTPLYSVLLAHANDAMEADRMAACGARMMFLQGVGALTGPLLAGMAIDIAGARSFFVLIGFFALLLGVFAIFRATRRSVPLPVETVGFAPMPLKTSPIGTEIYIETSLDSAESRSGDTGTQPESGA